MGVGEAQVALIAAFRCSALLQSLWDSDQASCPIMVIKLASGTFGSVDRVFRHR